MPALIDFATGLTAGSKFFISKNVLWNFKTFVHTHLEASLPHLRFIVGRHWINIAVFSGWPSRPIPRQLQYEHVCFSLIYPRDDLPADDGALVYYPAIELGAVAAYAGCIVAAGSEAAG